MFTTLATAVAENVRHYHVPVAISLIVLALFLFGAIAVSFRWPKKVKPVTIHIEE